MSEVRSKILITVAELGRLLDSRQPVVLLDVIDEPGAAPDDRPKIPGALSVNLAEDFSGQPTPQGGRRPLPDIGALQAKARAWGITNDGVVAVYDNSGGAQASRAWWTLRWAGLNNVRIVDGGYSAWIAADGASSNHLAIKAAHAGDVVLTPGHMPTINADEAAELAKQSKLFDARPRSSYAGDPAKSRIYLDPHGPDRFRFTAGPLIGEDLVFELDAEGKILRLKAGGDYDWRK